MRIEYHPVVEAELTAIKCYYEQRSLGLGKRFVDEFERQVLELAAKPEKWMVVQAGFADASCAGFLTSFISGVWTRSGSESL
jgi:hypothetical protein